jgi:hypothetical protein
VIFSTLTRFSGPDRRFAQRASRLIETPRSTHTHRQQASETEGKTLRLRSRRSCAITFRGRHGAGLSIMLYVRKARKLVVDALSGARVVFHHVPKCGGTSIARALHIRYIASFAGFPSSSLQKTIDSLHPGVDPMRQAQLVDDFQAQLLLFNLFRDVRCLSGHVRFSETAFGIFSNQYKFITTLREPVSLMISRFFYQRTQPSLWRNYADIDSYLESPEARLYGAYYSYFFNSLPTDADPQTPEAIECAKRNLRNFTVVGFVDDMEGFKREVRARIGIRLRFGVANQSKVEGSTRESVITPDIRKKIEKLSATNIEIYDFARSELRREKLQ